MYTRHKIPSVTKVTRTSKYLLVGVAFVCVAERCSLPVTNVEQIANVVADMRAS